MEYILTALPYVFQWQNILAMIIGTILGIIVGALPGLTVTMAIAIMIPLTFVMDPLTALAMMAGIYNGGMYGGAIPAILLRVPGTPAAIGTTFDGYPMARKGQAAYALETAVTSSGLGGAVSAIALILFAPLLVQVTLAFGPAEYFWVAVFGLSTVAVLVSGSWVKGLISACLGLLVGIVGMDPITGYERFTFGTVELFYGFNLVVLLIGLYSVPQALIMAEEAVKGRVDQLIIRLKKERPMFYGWRNLWRIWLRGSIIGMIVGLIPAAGGNIGSILSWNEAKRASKRPEQFGTGIPEGVAASEVANSADNSTALIPALTLGVPGNAVAAVILGGLLVHGLRPGPALFTDHPEIVYSFMIFMFITALMQLIIGWYGANLFVQFLRIPRIVTVPIIIALSTVGTYTLHNSMFDVWVMFGFGLVGYLMEKLEIPVAPMVLAVILGPMAEAELRRALLISAGDVSAIIFRPISMALIVMTLLVLTYPLIRWLIARRRSSSHSDSATEGENGR